MLIAIALVSFALVVPAQAQIYGTIVGETIPAPTTPGMLLPDTTLEVIFWIELDDRVTDSGLSGMDLLVSWDPAQATLSNISQGELWIDGAKVMDNDVDLDSDGDWDATYYTSDPPGPGLQHKILDMSTDTYLGDIPGTDGVAGTNLWPNKFEVTPGASSVFLQGYQDTPADFTLGSEGSAYAWAHLAFTLHEDLTATGLCLNLVTDTVGQLNSPTNTVDRLLFNMFLACPESPFPKDQEVSTAAGQVNEFEWAAGIVPEPSVFLLAGLGLLALLRRRR